MKSARPNPASRGERKYLRLLFVLVQCRALSPFLASDLLNRLETTSCSIMKGEVRALFVPPTPAPYRPVSLCLVPHFPARPVLILPPLCHAEASGLPASPYLSVYSHVRAGAAMEPCTRDVPGRRARMSSCANNRWRVATDALGGSRDDFFFSLTGNHPLPTGPSSSSRPGWYSAGKQCLGTVRLSTRAPPASQNRP